MKHTDVAIIGGGLAGLSVAETLRMSSLSVTLIEAGTRLGGRTYGNYWEAAGRHIDMGGTWLLPGFTRTFEYLAEFDIATIESPEAQRYLTHFRDGVTERQHLSEAEARELNESADELSHFINNASRPQNAEQALTALSSLSPLTEDWHRAMQRYLASAALTEVDALHLLIDNADLADPEHYHTQIEGTSQALVDALGRRLTASVHMGDPVTTVRQTDTGFTIDTKHGERFIATTVVVAAPLNTLTRITFDEGVLGSFEPIAQQGHTGAAVKDWLIIDGVNDHFRVYGSHGPYGYFRSEARLNDGGLLCVGLAPAGEGALSTADLEREIQQHYFKAARVRARTSHDWNEDEFSLGTWYVPRPGQYSTLEGLTSGHPDCYVVGGDVDPLFPGTIEGAIRSGQEAALTIVNTSRKAHSRA